VRPRVVIVGAGFGGLRAARALKRAPVDVVVIDRHNYHLFQPLLYQVAMAGLEPESSAKPVREILRGQANLEFRMADVTGVDLGAHFLRTSAGDVPYDRLIVACGGETNFFGLASVAELAFGMKSVPDAVAIRNHVLTCFERAVIEPDAERRRALLTFVVVGGGPTGVEMAGALSELIRLVLARDTPKLDIADVQVLLLEASPRLLAGMRERFSDVTIRTLRKKHVEVRCGTAVRAFDGERVSLGDGGAIAARTLIWAAGVRAAALAGALGVPAAAQGRVPVGPTLQLAGHDEVFVIGDAAYLEANGRPLPMMAPPAIQMGATAAESIVRSLQGKPAVRFRFRDPGSLATIGRNAAVADIRGFGFQGFPAWVVWLVVHLIQLIGFRNKLFVLINWAWDYFFYERGSRLITTD
jgi:NADH dehydrogenase